MVLIGNCCLSQICYFFYKNIAFGLTLFYFEAFTGFSGQSIFNDSYLLLFNVVLTSLPVISLGVFEQDVPSDVCLQVIYSLRHLHIRKKQTFLSLIYLPFSPSSFLHCINKAPRTYSSAGTESSDGWEMEFTHP